MGEVAAGEVSGEEVSAEEVAVSEDITGQAIIDALVETDSFANAEEAKAFVKEQTGLDLESAHDIAVTDEMLQSEGLDDKAINAIQGIINAMKDGAVNTSEALMELDPIPDVDLTYDVVVNYMNDVFPDIAAEEVVTSFLEQLDMNADAIMALRQASELEFEAALVEMGLHQIFNESGVDATKLAEFMDDHDIKIR